MAGYAFRVAGSSPNRLPPPNAGGADVVSDNAMQMIDYHAARAIEELECAKAASGQLSRRSHLDLSALHLRRAARLSADFGEPPRLTVVPTTPKPVGQATRSRVA